ATDNRVKIIVNTRNFGQVRSPYHALLQCRGDAVIALVADLQDPPELIPELIKRWEEGYRVVAAVKVSSEEAALKRLLRRLAYRALGRISSLELVHDFTGFGLYDRVVVDELRHIEDPYPYLRGLI